jgi:hypothetical protein
MKKSVMFVLGLIGLLTVVLAVTWFVAGLAWAWKGRGDPGLIQEVPKEIFFLVILSVICLTKEWREALYRAGIFLFVDLWAERPRKPRPNIRL